MVGNLIVERLSNHGKLRLLNLSKNLLSNSLALRLKKYLMEDNCLEELYLHWNEITDKGGKYLFDSLMYNKTLRVFDISWNALTGR
jgi:Ran GTPase-activating protein (RanGAP) involved in mRNA processing and transport